MNKITSISIICQQGVQQYFVGQMYNGHLLDRIDDCSLEYPESFVGIFIGRTSDNEKVFEVQNCPVEAAYELIAMGESDDS